MDYLVDGASAAERYTNELQRLPQPIPTIQEIKINTANTTAEYSRPGVVEVVTKSGGNELHGQLSSCSKTIISPLTNSTRSLSNFLVRNEFGGNISGPVVIPKLYNGKNKTFFFFDMEGIPRGRRVSESYIVPLPAWKQGDFSTYTDDAGTKSRSTIR